jgi:hypothetical protein
MILEIEYHNKVEILGLLKEKYGDKIDNNLQSVKWVQYENKTFLESVFNDNLNCIISENIQIVVSDYLKDSKEDLIYNRENEPISVDFFNPYENILTNAYKFVNEEDDYLKILMVDNLFTEEYTNQILFEQGYNRTSFLMKLKNKKDFFNYVSSNISIDYLKESYLNMLLDNLWNWDFYTYDAEIYAVLFRIIKSKYNFVCNDSNELYKTILTTVAIKQIVYEFRCVERDDKDFDILEKIDTEINDIIERNFFPTNNDLEEYYETNYIKILQNSKHIIIEYYKNEVLNKDKYDYWWDKFFEDIDYGLDYSTDDKADRSNIMIDYLSDGFNYG